MNSTDPASLQNLNDIVLPPTVSWWPLATGWYFVLALLALAVAWISYRLIRHRIENRYRRAALRELQTLANEMQSTEKRSDALRLLPVLLKRTALSVYPRSLVASLSSDEWYDFLNSQLGKAAFTGSVRSLMDRISYSTADLNRVDSQDASDLLQAVKFWMIHHRSPDPAKNIREP